MIHKNTLSLLWLALIFINLSCSQTQTERYPDGKLKSVLHYRGKVIDGVATWYHDNGNKSIEFNYHKGKIEGLSKRWYYNGTLLSTENYLNGVKNGLSVFYNDQGKKTSEAIYKNDSLDGPYREYHTNGQVMVEGMYWAGQFHGSWRYFNQKGLQIGKAGFNHGEGIQQAWYDNGKLMREIHYKSSKKEGLDTQWDQNGQIVVRQSYHNGILLHNVESK